MEQRRCPNCEVELSIGTAIRFDSQHNVICPECGKPLLPVVSQAESQVTPQAGINVKAVHNTYGPHPHHNSHYVAPAALGGAAGASKTPAHRSGRTPAAKATPNSPLGSSVEPYEHYMDAD